MKIQKKKSLCYISDCTNVIIKKSHKSIALQNHHDQYWIEYKNFKLTWNATKHWQASCIFKRLQIIGVNLTKYFTFIIQILWKYLAIKSQYFYTQYDSGTPMLCANLYGIYLTEIRTTDYSKIRFALKLMSVCSIISKMCPWTIITSKVLHDWQT